MASYASSKFRSDTEGGKVARQFSARSAGFVRFAVIVTAVAMLASFALSFNAQMAIAAMLSLPVFMRPLMPLGVDMFILVSVCSLTILREREGVIQRYDEAGKRIQGLRPWYRTAQGLQWSLMGLWTALSAALNAFHGFTVSEGSAIGVRTVMVMISIIFPLGVLTATETLMKILIAENSDSQALAAAKTRLINAGAPVAAQVSSGRAKSPVAAALDQQILDDLTFSFDDEGKPASQKSIAEKYGVPASRVKSVRSQAEQAA